MSSPKASTPKKKKNSLELRRAQETKPGSSVSGGNLFVEKGTPSRKKGGQRDRKKAQENWFAEREPGKQQREGDFKVERRFV